MFGGGGSIQLARVFGIRIGVDYSWFLILFLIIYWRTQVLRERVAGLERVRARGDQRAAVLPLDPAARARPRGVAIRNGIPIEGIDLWMFGGVAKLGRDTDSPGVEFRVAAAGPLVTLVIAAACFGIGSASEGGMAEMMDSILPRPDPDGRHGGAGSPGACEHGAAGLQPDSGLPARRRSDRACDRVEAGPGRNKATKFAARMGRGGLWLMVAGGVALFLAGDVVGGIWLAFIGFFLPARPAPPRRMRTSPGVSSTSEWPT